MDALYYWKLKKKILEFRAARIIKDPSDFEEDGLFDMLTDDLISAKDEIERLELFLLEWDRNMG